MLNVETAMRGGKHFPFSVAGSGVYRARVEARAFRVEAVCDVAKRGLQLNGYHLIFGLAFLPCAVQLLCWAVLKFWLFQP
jgi:hypothetical protein